VEEKIDAILRHVVRRVGTVPSRSLTAALNANRTMRQSIGSGDLNPAMAELRAVSKSVAKRLVAGFCRKSNWIRTLDPLLSHAPMLIGACESAWLAYHFGRTPRSPKQQECADFDWSALRTRRTRVLRVFFLTARLCGAPRHISRSRPRLRCAARTGRSLSRGTVSSSRTGRFRVLSVRIGGSTRLGRSCTNGEQDGDSRDDKLGHGLLRLIRLLGLVSGRGRLRKRP